MKCTLCGIEFNENQEQSACRSCPVVKGCRLIQCPNCGFEIPPEPRWLKTLWGWFYDCIPKNRVEIISLDTKNPKKLQKLMTMNLFPGMRLTLIQRFPCYVFQMGHSQFVIDQELAQSIFVRPVI